MNYPFLAITKLVFLFMHFVRFSQTSSLQNLAGATTSKSHERRADYAKAVGVAVRFKYPPDVEAVEQQADDRGGRTEGSIQGHVPVCAHDFSPGARNGS